MRGNNIKYKVIFRTVQFYEFDMARNLLSESMIPFRTHEDRFSDSPLSPTLNSDAGPGILYSILVPEQELSNAIIILSQLPFEIRIDSDISHFNARDDLKYRLKVVAWVIFALAVMFFSIYIKRLLHKLIV